MSFSAILFPHDKKIFIDEYVDKYDGYVACPYCEKRVKRAYKNNITYFEHVSGKSCLLKPKLINKFRKKWLSYFNPERIEIKLNDSQRIIDLITPDKYKFNFHTRENFNTLHSDINHIFDLNSFDTHYIVSGNNYRIIASKSLLKIKHFLNTMSQVVILFASFEGIYKPIFVSGEQIFVVLIDAKKIFGHNISYEQSKHNKYIINSNSTLHQNINDEYVIANPDHHIIYNKPNI